MKTALIIGYYFPPDGGAGTQRVGKFCKYLPALGWQPIVITRAVPAVRTRWDPEDASLLAELGDQIRILRAPVPDRASGWAAGLPSIDAAQPWLEPAYECVKHVLSQGPVDVVFITMSPFDLCYLGWKIQSEQHVPVIYDLRDPWALDGWRVYSNRRCWLRDRAAMGKTMALADGVIANTPEAKRSIMSAFPALSADRITVIPNGYDAEDFKAPPQEAGTRRDPAQFRLVHSGTLHTSMALRYRGPVGWIRKMRHYFPEKIQPAGRTELFLLEAMEILRDRKPALFQRLQVTLVGNIEEASRRCIQKSGLTQKFNVTGYVSHAQSISWLRNADALFLPLHGLPPAQRSLIVPGKVYEYIAAQRPILACLPPGDARDLVDESGLGVFAPPCNPTAIAAAIEKLVDDCDCDALAIAAGKTQLLERFERRELTHRLAEFMEKVYSDSGCVHKTQLSPAGAEPPRS